MDSPMQSDKRATEGKLLNHSQSSYMSSSQLNLIEYDKTTDKKKTLDYEDNKIADGQDTEFDSGRIRSASIGSTESVGDGSDKMGTF